MMQDHGGRLLQIAIWVLGVPFGVLAAAIGHEVVVGFVPKKHRPIARIPLLAIGFALAIGVTHLIASRAAEVTILSGTNALNASIILAIMVLPTVVSVSEDALQAVGRELREASYGLGATRAETMLRVVLPAASSGIATAVILGLMRAVGETMVVWMASGNSSQMPEPWYDVFSPIRTLTATIAGDMGEADQVTGAARYHVLFAMALVLLVVSFACNLASEYAVRRQRKKLQGV
jgi:phosphate transport system permease protein